MAFQQFLSAIQATRGAVFGRMLEFAEIARTPDTGHFPAAATETADIWLTPDLVKDYDPTDFGFLMPEEQRELGQAVSEFRRLTTGLQEVTPKAVAEGAKLFWRINAILHPHIDEPDLQRIAEATRSIPWPHFVLWTDARLATDSSGDPAVWIRFVLKDDVEIESAAIQDELSVVRLAYHDAIQRAGIDRWPYMTVRTRSETKELVRGAA